MPKEDKIKALDAALVKIYKDFGKGAVMKLGDKPQVSFDTIPTGSLALDKALGIGGLPKGRVIEIYGPESCLFENTKIEYEMRNDKQEVIEHKGITIRDLYEQFYDKVDDGIKYSELAFYIKSINEKEEVITQVIADVKKCGKKECFLVKTKSGKEIISTKDHKFYIGNKKPLEFNHQSYANVEELESLNYEKLENLKVNDTIYIREQNVIKEDIIESIEVYGEEETYDIKCFAPYNNYIANDIVVHNCGKTTLTLHMIAEAQKAGGLAGFIDAEHAMDPVYAKNIGVDIDNLYISQPDSGEQALEIVETFVRSGALDIIVVDSVAALVPKAELEGDMGDSHIGLQARLN